MGAKRKASQISVPQQDQQERRRSKRNAANDKNDEPVISQLNGNQIKVTTTNKKLSNEIQPTAIKQSTTAKKTIKTIKQTAKAIISEKIDFNKEIVPIRTYGKLNLKNVQTNPIKQPIVQSKRLANKNNAVSKADQIIDKISPISKTIAKKKVNDSNNQKKKGNLTISSPSNAVKPIQSQATISTIEQAGQNKVLSFIICFFFFLFC